MRQKSIAPSQKEIIARAIKAGPVPNLKDLDPTKWLERDNLTDGQKVCVFAAKYLKVPEGVDVGKPLILDPWQVAFVLAVFDNPTHTRKAIASVARRNGKTFVVAAIMLAYIVGPLAVPNSVIASAAHSRDQSALAFRLMALMLQQSPELDGLYRVVPSAKKIIGTRKQVEYMALSADAKTGHGKSIRVLLFDEAGQVAEPENDFISMLVSSQGSYDDARFFVISTQAPSDASYLSLEIDSSMTESKKSVVTHVYSADADCDIMDERQWYYANPGLGKYRSTSDLRGQLEDAIALPAKMPGVMNLLLNMRVSQNALFISPESWKACAASVALDVFRTKKVCIGLDLSMRTDLTAAVLAAVDDDGMVHLLPFVFAPEIGMAERQKRDRAPYQTWIQAGKMYSVPGPIIEYRWVAAELRNMLHDLDIEVDIVAFDRWRADLFKEACNDAAAFVGAEWKEVGQGFRDMTPRLENFEALVLDKRIAHGLHPLLNMSVANAVVETDAAGSRKLTKAKSTQRIDPLVAAVMAVFEVADGSTQGVGTYLAEEGAGLLFL